MRTALFLISASLLYASPSYHVSSELENLLSIAASGFSVMDISEFIKNMFK